MPFAVNLIVEPRIKMRTVAVGPAPPIRHVVVNQMILLAAMAALLLKFPAIELYVPV
jgi:hypothetical protein